MVPTERKSMPCRPSQHHDRNVHSVPPSLHRSHSLPPRFGTYFWGVKFLSVVLDVNGEKAVSNSLHTTSTTFLLSLQSVTNGEARKQGDHTHVSALWLTKLIWCARNAFQALHWMIWIDTLLERHRCQTQSGVTGGVISYTCRLKK